MNEYDDTTGFPVVPDDHYWEVSREDEYFVVELTQVIGKSRTTISEWIRTGQWHKPVHKVLGRRRVHVSSVTTINILESADFIMKRVKAEDRAIEAQKARDRARDSLLGVYPPRRLPKSE